MLPRAVAPRQRALCASDVARHVPPCIWLAGRRTAPPQRPRARRLISAAAAVAASPDDDDDDAKKSNTAAGGPSTSASTSSLGGQAASVARRRAAGSRSRQQQQQQQKQKQRKQEETSPTTTSKSSPPNRSAPTLVKATSTQKKRQRANAAALGAAARNTPEKDGYKKLTQEDEAKLCANIKVRRKGRKKQEVRWGRDFFFTRFSTSPSSPKKSKTKTGAAPPRDARAAHRPTVDALAARRGLGRGRRRPLCRRARPARRRGARQRAPALGGSRRTRPRPGLGRDAAGDRRRQARLDAFHGRRRRGSGGGGGGPRARRFLGRGQGRAAAGRGCLRPQERQLALVAGGAGGAQVPGRLRRGAREDGGGPQVGEVRRGGDGQSEEGAHP